MATRETGGGQQHSSRSSTEHDEDEVETPKVDDLQERREQLDEDVHAILDEIDEVLETNAAEFVQAFVQKGGQ